MCGDVDEGKARLEKRGSPGRLGVGDGPAARARYTGFVTTVDRGIIHTEVLPGKEVGEGFAGPRQR